MVCVAHLFYELVFYDVFPLKAYFMTAKLHAVLVNFELFKMSIRTIRTPHGSEAGADATDTGSQGVLMVRFYLKEREKNSGLLPD